MKLYTEEQVREMLKSTHIHTDNDVDMIIPKFTPIELPSDDDVEKKIEDSMCSLEFDTGFESGVKWMRNKIQESALNIPAVIGSPILAKIEHINDLGKSTWYEVVYYDDKWYSYAGSKTFQDGEQVVCWKYCKDCL